MNQAAANIEADLFGDVPSINSAHAAAEFTGTLAAAPQIRTRSEHGHPVPVLCMELLDAGPHGNSIHVEMPFTEAQRKYIEAQAHALKAGQRICATSPITAMHLVLPSVTSVTVAPAAQASH